MATDVERLLVRLEASAKSFENDMKRARKTAADSTKAIEDSFSSANRGLERSMADASAIVSRGGANLASVFKGQLAGLATAAVGAFSIAEVSKLSEEWTKLGNKIGASGVPMGRVAQTQSELVDISNRARATLEGTGTLYARLTRSSSELGASQADVAQVTETVAKALKLTGSSAAETESAIIQLSQGLQSGALQGDELRSLLENAPILTQAIAREFGVAVGQLKKLGEQGELTSARVFKALKGVSGQVERDFARTNMTLSDSFTILRNSAAQYVGTNNLLNNTFAGLATVVTAAANNFGTVATGATALGLVIASRLIATGLAPATVAFGQASLSGAAFGATMGAAAASSTVGGAAMGAAALAARGLAGALALVGGPVGAAILGTVAAVAYFGSQSRETAASTKFYEDALRQLSPAAREVDEAQKKMAQSALEAKDAFAAARSEVGTAKRAIEELAANQADAARTTGFLLERLEKLATARGLPEVSEKAKQVIEDLRSGKVNADDARTALEAMAATDGRFAGLLARLGGLATRLAVVAQAAREASAALLNADNAGRRPADQGEREEVRNRTAFTGERTRRAALPKDEKDIQDAAKQIEKDAREKGIKFSAQEATALAREVKRLEDLADPKKEKAGKAKKAEGPNDFQKELANTQKRTEALANEAKTIGQGTFAVERSKAAFDLERAAKEAGLPVSDALRLKINEAAEAYARAKVNIEEITKRQTEFNEVMQFAGTNISSFFSDIVSGGKNAEEALSNLTKRLADAALQAVLLGQGPLASLFGTAPAGGNKVGGLIGSLAGAAFGGVSGATGAPLSITPRANGGPVTPGQAYLVGEKRPELFVPRTPGTIVPRVPTGGGSGGMTINVSIDGGAGDAHMRQLVASGVQQGLASYDRRLPGRMADAARR